jgi:hypothetical protein
MRSLPSATAVSPYGKVTLEVVARAFSADAVDTAVRAVAGDPLVIGPLNAGPGGLGRADAVGKVRDVTITRDDDAGLLSYLTVLDVSLTLEVVVTGRLHRYTVDLLVPLRVTAVSASGGLVQAATGAPAPDAVTVALHPHGLQARLLAKVADVATVVQQEAAGYISRRLEQDDAQTAMTLPLVTTAAGAL